MLLLVTFFSLSFEFFSFMPLAFIIVISLLLENVRSFVREVRFICEELLFYSQAIQSLMLILYFSCSFESFNSYNIDKIFPTKWNMFT